MNIAHVKLLEIEMTDYRFSNKIILPEFVLFRCQNVIFTLLRSVLFGGNLFSTVKFRQRNSADKQERNIFSFNSRGIYTISCRPFVLDICIAL